MIQGVPKKYPLLKSDLLFWACVVTPLGIELHEFICVKLFCFIFVVHCYLADREVIIIPPFTHFNSQSCQKRTFKTKGLISIEGPFFGTPCVINIVS